MLRAMTAPAFAMTTTITPAAADTTPPGRMTAEVVTVNGSGCPGAVANYYFSDQSKTATKSRTFHGSLSDNWQATDKTHVALIVYALCGERRLFTINTDLRVITSSVGSKNTTSFMSMDSTDASVSTNYHYFFWKSGDPTNFSAAAQRTSRKVYA